MIIIINQIDIIIPYPVETEIIICEKYVPIPIDAISFWISRQWIYQ